MLVLLMHVEDVAPKGLLASQHPVKAGKHQVSQFYSVCIDPLQTSLPSTNFALMKDFLHRVIPLDVKFESDVVF